MNKRLNDIRLEIEALEFVLESFIKENKHPPFRARVLQQTLGAYGKIYNAFYLMLDDMDRNSVEYQECLNVLKYAHKVYQKHMKILL